MDGAGCGTVDLLEGLVASLPFLSVATGVPGPVGGKAEPQLGLVPLVEEEGLQRRPKVDEGVSDVQAARLRFEPIPDGGLDVGRRVPHVGLKPDGCPEVLCGQR